MGIKTLKKLSFFHIAIGIIILIGIIARTYWYIKNPSFWSDEIIMAINVIERSFKQQFDIPHLVYIAPPFFMMLEKFILNISGQINNIFMKDMVLRFIPYFSSVVSLPLYAYLVHKMFKNKSLTLCATALLSWNLFFIMYSIQSTRYSVEVLWSIILIWIFYELSIKSYSMYKTLLSSFIINISIWFAFSSFFIIGAGCFVIFVDYIKDIFIDKIKDKEKYLLKVLGIILPLFINFILFSRFYIPIKNYYLGFMEYYWQTIQIGFFSPDHFLTEFAHRLNELAQIPTVNDITILIIFVISSVLLICTKKYRQIILILVPIALVVTFAILHIYPFYQRTALFVLPSLFMLLPIFTTFIKENNSSYKYKTFLFILSFILIGTSINVIYTNISSRNYWILERFKGRELYNKIPQIAHLDKNVLATDLTYYYYNNSTKQVIEKKIGYYYEFKQEELSDILNKKDINQDLFIFITTFRSNEDKELLEKFIRTNDQLEVTYLEKSPEDALIMGLKKVK